MQYVYQENYIYSSKSRTTYNFQIIHMRNLQFLNVQNQPSHFIIILGQNASPMRPISILYGLVSLIFKNFVSLLQYNPMNDGKNIHEFGRGYQGKVAKIVPKTDAFDDEEPKANKQKIIKKKKIDHDNQDIRSMRWTPQENKIYIKFLQEHAHLFRYKSVRRIRQVFILLSDKMNRKRTPAQCKSHHQKMRKATQRGTIKEILSYMRTKQLVQKPQPQILAEQQIRGTQNQQLFQLKQLRGRYGYELNIKLRLDCITIW